jgi:hypothetical protein
VKQKCGTLQNILAQIHIDNVAIYTVQYSTVQYEERFQTDSNFKPGTLTSKQRCYPRLVSTGTQIQVQVTDHLILEYMDLCTYHMMLTDVAHSRV